MKCVDPITKLRLVASCKHLNISIGCQQRRLILPDALELSSEVRNF